MGILSNQRRHNAGGGFGFAAMLVFVALIAFAAWAIRRDLTGNAKPEVDTAADLVTSHETETPSPEPTEDYLRLTEIAGEAMDIEQRLEINRQVLANEQLAGTLQAAEATLEASIKLTDAAASRQIAELAVTESAHVAQAEMAAQAVEDAEEAKIERAKQRTLAEIEVFAAGILKIFLPALVMLVGAAVVVWFLRTISDDIRHQREIELATANEEPGLHEPVKAEVESNEGRTTNIYNLRCTLEQARFAAECVKNGRGITYAALIGELFTRAQVEDLQEDLIEQGLAEWRNTEHHAQGTRLLPAGWALMERIYQDSPSPNDEN
jgi:hypothetical protein